MKFLTEADEKAILKLGKEVAQTSCDSAMSEETAMQYGFLHGARWQFYQIQAELTEHEVTRRDLERQLTTEINVQRAHREESEKWKLVAKELESENAALKEKLELASNQIASLNFRLNKYEGGL